MTYPLSFQPIPKVRVWGGDLLGERRGFDLDEPVGESWEICDHDDDVSVVRAGPDDGASLRELFERDAEGLVGRAVDPASPKRFPLMLKIIDARKDLSVQVHPDDAYASAKKEGELGKTEAWYILDAEPGACLYHGLASGVDADALRKHLEAGTVADALERFEVSPGEVYFIPSGTVHALGAGVRIAEIQQNSDTTFRLYDWGRTGLDGKPRELHIEDSTAVVDFASDAPAGPSAPTPVEQEGCRRERFVSCAKFAFEKLSDVDGAVPLDTAGRTFHILTCVSGSALARTDDGELRLGPWDSCLVPAATGGYAVEDADDAEILVFSVPEHAE